MKKIFTLFFSLAMIIQFGCSKKNIGYFHNSYEPAVSVKEQSSTSGEVKNIASSTTQSAEVDQISASVENKQIPDVAIERPWKQVQNKKSPAILNQDLATTKLKNLSPKERHNIKQNLKKIVSEKNDQKTNRSFIGGLLLVILAVVLPPLAVLLVDGLSGPFWLSILLTILFWVPGVIYALYRIFKDR